MAKITALFFTALLLSSMLAHATRPVPGFNEELSATTQHLGADAGHDDAVVDSCEGVSEDECLMRRTLAAHLDYIYTQKHKP
ncbi:phytosulfokines-like [Neltuma alba]|uniref:phytosulfokines-like n=1 Tax=Neltuma alba TaxID=207710 RepID=UPI0010A4793B|nr:phytosulfokines-like [Prosopis alba]XP_028797216.1 phytosulfokines-like [Prosopis alba]